MSNIESETRHLHHFDVQSVPLQGRNLIEASAGTGKTYSIAILALRLILENKVSINKILMVTFTKAAVAELEERIRLFVRNAYKIANGDSTIQDPTLTTILSRAIDKNGRKETLELLKEAKLLLDETAVMTIHSFCQLTLGEFALETHQLFESEMVQDMTAIRQEKVDDFWRQNITTLDPILLQNIIPMNFSRSSIAEIIDKSLGGQRFLFYDKNANHSFTQEDEIRVLGRLGELNKTLDTSWTQLIDEVVANRLELLAKCDSNFYTRKNLLPLIDDPHNFLTKLTEVKEKANAIKTLGDWIDKLALIDKINDEKRILTEELTDHLYCTAIEQISTNIKRYKDDQGLLSFDDLITRLYQAINSNGSSKLKSGLREKYQAVFIDEFQDTDKFQYEIFDKAFDDQTVVFYIGDPKQSIYAWRQADINTYFKAGREVDNRYSMNVNYRSGRMLIESMNSFFRPTEDFDTFNFKSQDDGISYIPVEAPKAGKELHLSYQKSAQAGITIFSNANKAEILETFANQVLLLLTDKDYSLDKDGLKRRIRPSDIGVLVRSNSEGLNVKKQLSKLGITAVTIDTNKVLMTREAQYIYHLLRAFVDINIHTVSRALLNPLTGFNTNDLLQLNYDEIFLEFGILKQIWETSGTYSALTKFIKDFNVKETLLSTNRARTLTNVLQIIEILHKTQSLKNLSALELLNWLKMASEGMKMDGDEYEQRIESDEEAVEIVTIHKSKGLEYNIVFAPFLDMKASFERKSLISLKSASDQEYIFAQPHRLNDEQRDEALTQIEQENRRLIYVAITRAVYKCYIFRNNHSAKNSSLTPFIEAARSHKEESAHTLIEFADQPEIETNMIYQSGRGTPPIQGTPIPVSKFELRQRNWVKMSYTFLARKPEYIRRENDRINLNSYDHFIFKQLVKGSLVGNFLHDVFENIDFTNDTSWEKQIQASLARYLPKHDDSIVPMVNELVYHVVNSSVNIDDEVFTLSKIAWKSRLNELEFNFNVSSFLGLQLNQLAEKERAFVVRSIEQLEGVMNGIIDMVFQHNDRYYILDWKSNFLGDSLIHYEQNQLNDIMTENNYHLQYLIYVVALKKYLQQRLSNFDYNRDFGGVIYFFIRGARAGQQTGIYTTKPSIDYINKLENLLSEK